MTVVGVHSWSGGPISTLLRKANIEQAAQAQSIPVVADRGNTRQLGIYGICRASAVASHSDPTTRNRLRAQDADALVPLGGPRLDLYPEDDAEGNDDDA